MSNQQDQNDRKTLPVMNCHEEWIYQQAALGFARKQLLLSDLMATAEAKTAGNPFLGNDRPRSPIEHGVSRFLSSNPYELREYARLLPFDLELTVKKMGTKAREKAAEHFSMSAFRHISQRSNEIARYKWHRKNNHLHVNEAMCA
jgi:hypothetical protein